MKKLIFSTILVVAAISLVSCGSNRKLGCPSTAKNTSGAKTVQS